MIERLHRQRRRAVLAETAHALVSDASAHLHQAVEAAPAAPRPRPAIGVERHVNQPGPCLPPTLGAEAEPGECVRPIAMDQHIRLVEQG